MPCDFVYQEERELERLEKEREEQMKAVEEALGCGIAQIVDNYDGSYSIVGVELPDGMLDGCVMAGLQERSSMEFEEACDRAGVGDKDFIKLHGDH